LILRIPVEWWESLVELEDPEGLPPRKLIRIAIEKYLARKRKL
jgi:hypothetical protein